MCRFNEFAMLLRESRKYENRSNRMDIPRTRIIPKQPSWFD
jgi:hypothetical protein